MLARAHVIVSGAVQGVGFRFGVRNEAMRLGVSGWVRNRIDGKVEAVFEGEKAAIIKLIEYCYSGPSGSEVADVEFEWEKHKGEFHTFEVRN